MNSFFSNKLINILLLNFIKYLSWNIHSNLPIYSSYKKTYHKLKHMIMEGGKENEMLRKSN